MWLLIRTLSAQSKYPSHFKVGPHGCKALCILCTHTYIAPSGRSSIAYLRFSTSQLLQSTLMVPSGYFLLRYIETQVCVPLVCHVIMCLWCVICHWCVIMCHWCVILCLWCVILCLWCVIMCLWCVIMCHWCVIMCHWCVIMCLWCVIMCIWCVIMCLWCVILCLGCVIMCHWCVIMCLWCVILLYCCHYQVLYGLGSNLDGQQTVNCSFVPRYRSLVL